MSELSLTGNEVPRLLGSLTIFRILAQPDMAQYSKRYGLSTLNARNRSKVCGL